MDNPDLWQEAQDRVLLYLKRLEMPAILSLEIAHEALQKALDEAPAAGSIPPLVLAMRALQMIFLQKPGLLENTPYAEQAILYRRWRPEKPAPPDCSVTDPATGLRLATLPPINRGSMTIKKI